jgi:hypothetical protein
MYVCMCVYVCVYVCMYVGRAGLSVQGQLIGSGMDESCNSANHAVYIIITTALTLLHQHAPIGSKEYVIVHRCTMKCLVHLCIRLEINI